MMPPAEEIRIGKISFPVWRLGDGRYAFDYAEGSSRRVIKRRSLEDLKAEGRRIATNIINGETEALRITPQECRIYIAAREAVAPAGIEVDRAAAILAEAVKLVGDPSRLIEACRNYSLASPSQRAATVGDVVEHYLRHIESDTRELYAKGMRKDLEKFASAFPVQIAAVRTLELEDWLRDAKSRTDKPVGKRRRRNLRGKLVSLFNWCRNQGYLSEGLRTEAEKTRVPKVERHRPPIYTPGEIDLLIQQAHLPASSASGRRDRIDFLPFLVIGAFAGIRTAEILRLNWGAVKWEESLIEVNEDQAKVDGYRRLVPIPPNLMSWLQPYRGSRGPIAPFTRPDNILGRLCKRAGISSKRNGLRHSFGSYRCAVTKNLPEVAYEMGNSPTEVKKSYLNAVPEREANAWFSIARPAGDNVIQIPLLNFG